MAEAGLYAIDGDSTLITELHVARGLTNSVARQRLLRACSAELDAAEMRFWGKRTSSSGQFVTVVGSGKMDEGDGEEAGSGSNSDSESDSVGAAGSVASESLTGGRSSSDSSSDVQRKKFVRKRRRKSTEGTPLEGESGERTSEESEREALSSTRTSVVTVRRWLHDLRAGDVPWLVSAVVLLLVGALIDVLCCPLGDRGIEQETNSLGTGKNTSEPAEEDDENDRVLYARLSIIRIFFEVLLMLLLTAAVFWLQRRKRVERALRAVFRARTHLQRYGSMRMLDSPTIALGVDNTVVSPSTSYVAVLRDSVWSHVPLNTVVRGDIVGVLPDQRSPVDLVCVEPGFPRFKLDKGDVLQAWKVAATALPALAPPLLSSRRLRFECRETPAVAQLVAGIGAESPSSDSADNQHSHVPDSSPSALRNRDRTTLLQKTIEYGRPYIVRLRFASLVVLLIGASVRAFLQPIPNLTAAASLFLLRPAYALLPTLGIIFPFLMTAGLYFGNATVLALFDHLQSKSARRASERLQKRREDLLRKKNSAESPTSPVDETRRSKKKSVGTRHDAPWKLVISYLQHLVGLRIGRMRSSWSSDFDNRSLSGDSHLVELLGGATVVSVIDKDGILADAGSYPEQLLLFHAREGSHLNGLDGAETAIETVAADAMADAGVDAPFVVGGGTAESAILNLSRVPSSVVKDAMELQFDDTDWKHFMNVLKPLGLTMMLNNNCRPAQDLGNSAMRPGSVTDELNCLRDRLDPRGTAVQCLCALAEHIGFSPHIGEQFSDAKMVYNFSPDDVPRTRAEAATHPSPYMSSLVVEQIEKTPVRGVKGSDPRRKNLFPAPQKTAKPILQLLTRGAPELVLQHCTSFFDGAQLHPLTDSERSHIITAQQHWYARGMTAIGFAYRPMDPVLSAAFVSRHKKPTRRKTTQPEAKRAVDIQVVETTLNRSQILDFDDTSPKSDPLSRAAARPHPMGRTSSFAQFSRASKKVARLSADTAAPIRRIKGKRDVAIRLHTPRRHVTNAQPSVPALAYVHYNPAPVAPMQKSYSAIIGAGAVDAAFSRVQSDQIFLGMVGLRTLPKLALPKRIEDFHEAGIRFVHFSRESESRAKQFADKLGLETDWNTCISLDDASAATTMHRVDDYVPAPDPNMMNVARPHGVDQVLHSLRDEDDDMPLLVPLFCDVSPSSCRDMIAMQQEYGQHVVLCVGSVNAMENTSVFAQADISFAVEPDFKGCAHHVHQQDGGDNFEDLLLSDLVSSAHFASNGTSTSLACDLTALPCEFIMHRYSKFSHINAMVKNGRHMLVNIRTMLLFYIFGSLWLHIAQVLVFLLTPSWFISLNGLQIIWLTVVVLPLLSVMLLLTAREQAIMHQIAPKNELSVRRFEDARRGVLWRGSFAVVLFLGVYTAALSAFWSDFTFRLLLGTQLEDKDVRELTSAAFDDAQAYAQEFVMLSVVMMLCIQSWAFAHNSESVLKAMFGSSRRKKEAKVFRTRQFWFIAAVCIAQVIWSSVSLSYRPFILADASADMASPWILLGFLLLAPILFVMLDEILKVFERKRDRDHQTFLRMMFDTKLGRYSPK